MKLLYIHQYFKFPTSAGGTRSYDLSTQFVKNGIDVTMVTSSSALPDVKLEKRWTYMERDGVRFWILKCDYSHNMSIFRRIMSFFVFVIYTSFKVCKIEADLLLATSTPLTIAIPAIIKKKITKTPFIFEVRDVWPEGPIQQGFVKNKFLIKYLRKLEVYIYNQAEYVVPLSIGMKNDILTRSNIKNIKVIPNISELDRFSNMTKKCDLPIDLSDKKMILYAGTLGPVNDILYVAKLAERLINIDNSIVFFVIGDGKQKRMIIDYCDKANILNKNIFFIDEISKDTLPYIYSLATMGSSFVWDYKIKWDNSANKVFDTLAAGKPLLINYQGWQADLINMNHCGFVLPYNILDRDILRFVRYVNDSEVIKNEGRNARRKAIDFSLPIAVNKYMEIFNFIIDEKA